MGDPCFLLHVTQADRWPAVISNLRNLADQGRSSRVRVMINGTAIYAVQGDNDWTEAMREAAMESMGIPCITVETDYYQGDVEQLNTRMGAFVEMMG